MKKIFLALLVGLCMTASVFALSIEPNGINQEALYKFLKNCASANSNRAITTGALTATSATTATFNVGTTFPYVIDGAFYSKTASATVAGVSATVQATGTSCMYPFCVNTSGDVSVVKGLAVPVAYTPAVPDLPASKAPFATLKVAVTAAATSSFTLGTTATAGITGQTLTIKNISTVQNIGLTDF